MNFTLSPRSNQSEKIPPRSQILNEIYTIPWLSVLGILGNIVTIIVIFSNKPFRKPCFRFIAGASIAATAVSFNYLMSFSQAVSIQMGLVSPDMSALRCLFGSFGLHLFAIPFQFITTCLIGIDRLVSI